MTSAAAADDQLLTVEEGAVAGLSPRAALAIIHTARAWAMLEDRDKVLPEDVQAILPGVAAHRLRPAHDSARRVDVGAQLLAAVPIP